MTAVLKGYEEVSRRIKLIAAAQALENVASRAFRSTIGRVKKEAISEAKTRGVLRSIAQRSPRWLSSLVKLSPIEQVDNKYQGRLRIVGLATIQETGGRIRAHVIRPKMGSRLVFRAGGRTVAVREVKHPGSTHPAIPFFEPAVAKAAPKMIEDVQKQIALHLAKAASGVAE